MVTVAHIGLLSTRSVAGMAADTVLTEDSFFVILNKSSKYLLHSLQWFIKVEVIRQPSGVRMLHLPGQDVLH